MSAFDIALTVVLGLAATLAALVASAWWAARGLFDENGDPIPLNHHSGDLGP
jgi:hypothetical protein